MQHNYSFFNMMSSYFVLWWQNKYILNVYAVSQHMTEEKFYQFYTAVECCSFYNAAIIKTLNAWLKQWEKYILLHWNMYHWSKQLIYRRLYKPIYVVQSKLQLSLTKLEELRMPCNWWIRRSRLLLSVRILH